MSQSVILARLMASAGLQSAGLVILFVDRFLLSAILLQAWGVNVFEDWSVLLAAAGMMNLLDFGLHQTFSNAYTRHFQSGNKEKFTRQMSVGFAVMGSVCCLGVLGLLLGLYGGFWLNSIAVKELSESAANTVLLLLAISTIVQTAAGITNPVYRAQGAFNRGLVFELSGNSARLILVSVIVLSGGDVLAAASGYLLATLVAWSAALWDQYSHLEAMTARPRWLTGAEFVAIARVAPWFYVQHASNVLLLGVPLLVLGHVQDQAGGIAAFMMIRTLANFVRQFCQIIANGIGIELSRRWFQTHDAAQVQGQIARSNRFVAVCVGALLAALVPFVDEAFRLWSGGQVSPRFDVVFVIFIGVAFSAPGCLIAAYLNYIDEARIGAYSRIVTVVVAGAAGILLVEPLGILGVAVALALGEITGLSLLYLPATANWIGISSYSLLQRWLFWLILGVAPASGTAWLIGSFPSSVSTLLLKAVAVPIVSAWSIYQLGLSRSDRVIARRYLAKGAIAILAMARGKAL